MFLDDLANFLRSFRSIQSGHIIVNYEQLVHRLAFADSLFDTVDYTFPITSHLSLLVRVKREHQLQGQDIRMIVAGD